MSHSGSVAGGLRVNRPTENVTAGTGLKASLDLDGERKNIVQENNAPAPAGKAAEESAVNFWH